MMQQNHVVGEIKLLDTAVQTIPACSQFQDVM